MSELEKALLEYQKNAVQYIGPKVVGNYCTYLRALQSALQSKPESSPQIIKDWIMPCARKKEEDAPIEDVISKLDACFPNVTNGGISNTKIGKYKKSDVKSALISFSRFILGYYKANIYTSMSRLGDLQNCKLVAQNAIFCTIEVAEGVKDGKYGAKVNKQNINGNQGNKYYSWFRCGFQRRQPNQQRGAQVTIPSGAYDPQIRYYTLDENTKGGLAIKNAVLKGLPNFLKSNYRSFEGYMACHIWDKSCYDYRYHTSVFNLVLLPMSIAGLSDYCDEVKHLLQYESAYRFGVYPNGSNWKLPSKPTYYDAVDSLWRQPDEHQIAKKNQQYNAFSPQSI